VGRVTSVADRLSAVLTGRYRIERELSAGGMATVYLAEDLRHKRRVALKVLKPELAAVLGAERFVQEITTTANLQHPHILPLFDSGTADGFLYYVMPFIEGETLRNKLSRETQLGVDEAVRIAAEVADALHYAHSKGVIHRDIKPENILLHDGRPMVADFGIALAVSAAAGERMTETGLSLGTPHYMSPEQATAEKDITGRSDVYSLASVLYEMLAGQPPHVGGSAQQIIMKIIAEPVDTVTRYRKAVPPNIAAALARALENLPADRFASAKDFADALRNPTFAGNTTASFAAVPSRAPGINRTAFVFGATAIIATIVAVIGWLRPGDPREVSRYIVVLPEGQQLGQSQGSRIALSPDGTVLAYESAVAGQSRLLLRRRDALVGNPIAGTDGAVNPAFSPDGKRLAFAQLSPRAIRVMSLPNGLVSTIADSLVDLGGVSWGHDGYVYYDGHLDGDGIARVRETGGPPEPVTRADSASGEFWHFRPHALPNGRNVLFTIARGVGGGYQWFVGATEVGSGGHVTLIEGRNPHYADGFLFFTTEGGLLMAVKFDQDRLTMEADPVPVAEGVARGALGRTELAFSETGALAYTRTASSGGQGELAWVSRDGAITRVDTTWRAAMSQLAVSPDGRRVAFQLSSGPDRSDIWVKELDHGTPARVSFGGAPIHREPSWTPDSREIVFTAAGGGTAAGVMRGPADGSLLPRRIRPFPGDLSSARLSPDGGWLVIEDGGGDLFAARTGGDTALVDLVRESSIDVAPRVSPNGRWLAYLSDESSQRHLYVTPFPETESAKRVISTESVVSAWWSPDGRELAYMTNAGDLTVAPVLAGAAFAVGEKQVLFNAGSLEGGPRFTSLVYSHDGQRFLAVVPVGQDDAPDELIMVENFMSEVRARVKQ
jgi:serine/threonine-protein kinase